MILAVWASIARADELSCPELAVLTTLPRNHADDVPIDLRPAVVFDGGACAIEATFRLVLNIAGEGEFVPIAEATVTPDPVAPLAELPLDAPLDPLTRYRLDLEDADGVLRTAASFTTGEHTVAAGLSAPAAPQLVSAWSYRSDGAFRVQAGGTILAEADPDELSVLRVALADDPAFVVDIAPLFFDEPASFGAHALLQERLDPLCLVASRIDGAGREGAASEPGCAELGRGDRAGCATGPNAGRLGAALAGLALLRRRIRR